MSLLCWRVLIGMRTEAKPLLGRSVRAYSNERYCDRRLGKPGLHVLPALAPRMVLLRPPHDPDSGGWRNWQRDSPCRLLQFGKADSLPAVVHLHSPVLPFTNQCLALCGTVALLARVQL